MLKKLQNLLFEDEGDEEFEEEEVREEPVVKRKPAKVNVEETPKAKPVETIKSEPTMTRIDVTQPIPTVKKEEPVKKESVFTTPSTQHVAPRPVAEPVQPKAPTLGITVDEVKPFEQPKPAARPVAKPQTTAKKAAPQQTTTTKGNSLYEFKPVISPMFGVDEKDMNAMQITANTAKTNGLEDNGMSNIISPIYGMNQEARPSSIQTTVERSNEMETLTYTKEAQKAEDEIPSFSLDDILNARDEEFAHESDADAHVSAEPQDIDETIVIDSKNLSPFGHVNVPDAKKGK